MESKVFEIIAAEQARQNANIELIASENIVSPAVLAAAHSCTARAAMASVVGRS